MRIRWRGFTSLLVAIAFLAMGFSGILLYFTPKGRVAHWTDWTILGLGKEEWAGVHMNFALLFFIAAGFHWFFNWNLFWSYIKKRKARRLNLVPEIVIAAIIAIFFLIGTIFPVPPLSTIVWGRGEMENYWEVHSPRPPAPHAEEFKLKRFANAIGLPLEVVIKTLEEEGYTVPNHHITVRQLAEQKNGAPCDILAVIQKHYPTAGTRPPGCMGQKRGCNAPDKKPKDDKPKDNKPKDNKPKDNKPEPNS